MSFDETINLFDFLFVEDDSFFGFDFRRLLFERQYYQGRQTFDQEIKKVNEVCSLRSLGVGLDIS